MCERERDRDRERETEREREVLQIFIVVNEKRRTTKFYVHLKLYRNSVSKR